MTKLFIDTNIIIDLIADRRPFSKFATDIFIKAEQKKVKLYVSSHSIATSHYLLKKYLSEKELRETLYNLLDFVSVISIDTDIIKKGLKSKIRDFEDALQILSAHSIEKLDYIVTRNIKDFKDSGIMVLAPDEVVSKI